MSKCRQKHRARSHDSRRHQGRAIENSGDSRSGRALIRFEYDSGDTGPPCPVVPPGRLRVRAVRQSIHAAKQITAQAFVGAWPGAAIPLRVLAFSVRGFGNRPEPPHGQAHCVEQLPRSPQEQRFFSAPFFETFFLSTFFLRHLSLKSLCRERCHHNAA
jgi:hypothetical protein